MQGNRVPVTTNSSHNYLSVRDSSVRGSEPDINGLAAANNRSASVMVWNYHDKNTVNVPATMVSVSIKGLGSRNVVLKHYRIDQEHSNSFTAWKKMGSPQDPSSQQITELEKAGQLQMVSAPEQVKLNKGEANIQFILPRQGVSLLKLEW